LLRYDFGKTYGEGTHHVYQVRTGRLPEIALGDRSSVMGQLDLTYKGQPTRELDVSRDQLIRTRKGQTRRALPLSDGSNKYTEDMVPGYTGYIPRYPFKFGDSYKEECDICLDEHFTNLSNQTSRRVEALGRSQQASLKAVQHDPEVRDQLNGYRTTHSALSRTPRIGVYRPPILDKEWELPIPGYRGFIPRVNVTEIGLGTRYTEQTKNGLDWFYTEHARRAAMLASKPPGEGQTSRERLMDRYQGTTQRTNMESSRNNSASYTGKQNGSLEKKSDYVCEHKEHSFSRHPSGVQKSVAFVA